MSHGRGPALGVAALGEVPLLVAARASGAMARAERRSESGRSFASDESVFICMFCEVLCVGRFAGLFGSQLSAEEF